MSPHLTYSYLCMLYHTHRWGRGPVRVRSTKEPPLSPGQVVSDTPPGLTPRPTVPSDPRGSPVPGESEKGRSGVEGPFCFGGPHPNEETVVLRVRSCGATHTMWPRLQTPLARLQTPLVSVYSEGRPCRSLTLNGGTSQL